jgi:hypothetical protein
MKCENCSICAATALAIAIAGFALIALFWGTVLLFVLNAGDSAAATSTDISGVATGRLKITDITGGITAFCALIVAVGSLYISMRHHRLSVMPKLSIVRVIENNDGEKKGLYLRNHGLGPAIIAGIVIELKSQNKIIHCYEDLKIIFSLYGFEIGDLGTYWLDVLPKDACERFIWLESSANSANEEFMELMKDIKLTVLYESFYEEKRMATYG